MATISEILSRFWPGTEWTITSNDYATLIWYPSNQVEKPSETEILSHSTETDTIISNESKARRQQVAMNDAPDYLLKAIEILINGMVEIHRVIQDIRNTIVAQAHTGDFTTWDVDAVQKIQNLRARIQELRNIT